MKNVAQAALGEHRIMGLAKIMHKVVKAAVKLDAARMDENKDAVEVQLNQIHSLVGELPWTDTVIRGWIDGKESA